jgi:glutathione peroxidase-family protein
MVVLSLIAIGGISSCTSSDEKGVATKPGPAPQAKQPAAPKQSLPPAAPTSLSANVLATRLQTVNGGTVSLGDYSGKVMLVNLWATWCGPCRSEIPELVKLHKEFKSKGFEIVGLSTEDPTNSAESVKNFVQSFNMDYHVGWAPREVAISFMQLTQRDAIPQSFIISRDGRVLKQFVGFNPIGTPPQIRQAIEDALKG